MRILLYTGKGGVGKTSVAAATALRAAEMGHRTLVLSTDAAHSLSDSFDLPLGPAPQPIVPNLWGQETEMSRALGDHWATVQQWLAALMEWRGADEIVAEEMTILPGMEELANLLYLVHYSEGDEYDVVIVDCAPTGETLRLLGLPELIRWWMQKIFPIERKAARLIRPVMKRLTTLPIPDDKVFDAVEQLFSGLDKMHALLADPDQTTARLVVNAEKMVIKEAQRTFTYLNLYGYSTDLIICNRLIPESVSEPYFAFWKENQGRYLQMIEECFSPLPLRTLPFFQQEVVGLPMLREMARALFDQEDPTKIFFHGQAQRIQKEDGYYILTLPLPFVTKEEISLVRSGNELIVRAGRHQRNILLPHTLVGLPVEGAKLEGDRLRIRFKEARKG